MRLPSIVRTTSIRCTGYRGDRIGHDTASAVRDAAPAVRPSAAPAAAWQRLGFGLDDMADDQRGDLRRVRQRAHVAGTGDIDEPARGQPMRQAFGDHAGRRRRVFAAQDQHGKRQRRDRRSPASVRRSGRGSRAAPWAPSGSGHSARPAATRSSCRARSSSRQKPQRLPDSRR